MNEPIRILSLHRLVLPAWLGEVHRACTRAHAEALTQALQPDVIAVEPSSCWAADFVRSLPATARPAVVAIGDVTLEDAELFDEWLSGRETRPEAVARVGLAVARATSRRRAARLAYVDPLTGLPNRRALLRALGREAARARRRGGELALVLVDLDHFKEVNDTQGHPEGDKLLRQVGRQLASATRHEELCARIGGDEFAIVVAGGLAQAEAAARRVREALDRITVPATVAAVELSPHERLSDLYRRADERLRAEKRARHARQSAERAA